MPTPPKVSPLTNLKNISKLAGNISNNDKLQSLRLHEPHHRIMTTDPITGNEVDDYMSRPSTLNGDLTVYFENTKNCEEYLNIPFNHPNLKLPYPATDEDDRGG